MKTLKIASRKSALARLQSYKVADAIKKKYPLIEIEFQFSESLGDKNLNDPLWKMPEKGVFTSDFTEGLIQKKYDLVVHSWKDLPIEENSQTAIVATLNREPSNDLLLIPKNKDLSKSQDIKILSSSPRREYNLKNFLKEHVFIRSKEISFLPVRGNIQTRVEKLLTQDADALVVAFAAIKRLLEFQETKDLITNYLNQLSFCIIPITVNPPAAAQGALAIEVLKDNKELIRILDEINCSKDFRLVEKERLELKKHGGGCHQKIGVLFSSLKDQELKVLKGLTKEGLKLDEVKLYQKTKIQLLKPWSESRSKFKIFSKNSLEILDDYWINEISKPTRSEVMISHPFVLENPKVITFLKKLASVKTVYFTTSSLNVWKKMSEFGFFVYGSAEGIGIQIEHLNSEISRFKLSHQDSSGIDNSYQLVPCYKLEPKKLSDLEKTALKNELLSSDGYFWSSYTQFKYVSALQEQILTRHHFCGPGLSYDNIKHHLENVIGHSKNLCSYLNEQDWLQAQAQN